VSAEVLKFMSCRMPLNGVLTLKTSRLYPDGKA